MTKGAFRTALLEGGGKLGVAEEGALAWDPGLQESVQPMASAPCLLPAEPLEEPAHPPRTWVVPT